MSKIGLGKAIGKILGRIRNPSKRARTEENSSNSTPSNSPVQSSRKESERLKRKIPDKVYLKAMPLKSIEDIDSIKDEVESGNILIIRVSPLASNNIDDVKHAVNELCEFTDSHGGDIARLGEERIVITPPFVKIWREKGKTSEVKSTLA